MQYPKLVIEVLSESTEAFDRGVKFRDYGELMSLEEYVLVSQHECLVERFTRKGDGSWRLDRYANDDRLHLESLDCMIDLDAVYEDVTLSTERGDAGWGDHGADGDRAVSSPPVLRSSQSPFSTPCSPPIPST